MSAVRPETKADVLRIFREIDKDPKIVDSEAAADALRLIVAARYGATGSGDGMDLDKVGEALDRALQAFGLDPQDIAEKLDSDGTAEDRAAAVASLLKDLENEIAKRSGDLEAIAAKIDAALHGDAPTHPWLQAEFEGLVDEVRDIALSNVLDESGAADDEAHDAVAEELEVSIWRDGTLKTVACIAVYQNETTCGGGTLDRLRAIVAKIDGVSAAPSI